MKKPLIFTLTLFSCFCLFAQQKGTSPLKVEPINSSVTRAVIVGISDYQDPGIPDLRFAHRDAEAFAAYLRSPPGGSLGANQLKLLTNEQATAGRFVAALSWLIETSQEGDNAIIYFSGHGDVERITINQPGFLLLWDAPPQTYMAGGAFGLFYLQDVISTLSLQNNSQVVLIVDACHSGKLAGTPIGGAQATTANLARIFQNEIRILSCQPDEFSIEGEQWGGGRGVFSYHFVNGMYGLADANGDQRVNLYEMDRYLEDQVRADVTPMSQVPLTFGKRSYVLARVYPEVANNLSRRLLQNQAYRMEEALPEQLDTAYIHQYASFVQALEKKAFFSPVERCAETLFQQLINEPQLAELHTAMRRNYAAALQDSAQQVINRILKGDRQEVTLTHLEQMQQYKDFPRMLARSAELLGPAHYLYKSLKARQYLFEGYLRYLESLYSNVQDTAWAILNKYHQSLQLEPDNPVTNYHMSRYFATKIKDPDSTWHYAMEAARCAKTWVLPYTTAAYHLSRYFGKFQKAKIALDKAIQLDSNDYHVWNAQGAWHFYQEQYLEAIDAYEKSLKLDSTLNIGWYNLGICYISIGQMDEGEKMLFRSISERPIQFSSYYALGVLYEAKGRLKEAEVMFRKVIKYHPIHTMARERLAAVLIRLNRFKEAEQQYIEIIKIDPVSPNEVVWYNLACFAAMDDRRKQALAYLEKSIQKGITWDIIQNDKDLTVLFGMAEFQNLIKRYFAEQVKD